MSNLWNNPFFLDHPITCDFLLGFLCLELTHWLIGTLLINLLFLQHRIISWQILQLQHRITNLQLCNMGWVNDISWTDASQTAKPDIYAYIPIIVFGDGLAIRPKTFPKSVGCSTIYLHPPLIWEPVWFWYQCVDCYFQRSRADMPR